MLRGVDLGYLERSDPWKLHCRFFPSKVGGKPAWLSLNALPSAADLECASCKVPMVFFLQVYAPIEDRDDTFHRTIFIFVCRKTNCVSNNRFVVFRSQLPRCNHFYPLSPPLERKSENFDVQQFVKLCNVCGGLSDKMCGNCKAINYCSRNHQNMDWKLEHKLDCKIVPPRESSIASKQLLFPEHELVIEPEELEDEAPLRDEAELLAEFEELKVEGLTGTMSNTDEEDLAAHALVEEDETFLDFRKRVNHFPDQVLRYQRNGIPLWISKEQQPQGPDDIPACEYCGGKRIFEFQILPQLLFELKETKFDYGTLLIYTCAESCSSDALYKHEYLLQQDVSK